MSEPDALTPKQQRFVLEYLKDLNATQAAIRAGYSGKTAAAIGAENLTKPEIAAAVQGALAQQNARLTMDADEAQRINATLVRFDPIVLMDDGGNVKALKDIPPEARQCIRRIRVHKQNLTAGDGKTDRVLDIEFYDKQPALDRDYKRLGLLKERIDVTHHQTLEDLIVASKRSRQMEGSSNADSKS
jgi:phage terminase small subunit